MRRLLIFFLLLLPLGAGATPLDSLFVAAPQELLPLLDRNARLNLLDFHHAGMAARAENRLGGEARLLELTDDRLALAPTGASRWELVRVPWGSDSALVCLHTLTLPAEDTRVGLFTTAWQPLPLSLPVLELADFWVAPDSLTASRCRELQAQLAPLHVVWTCPADAPGTLSAEVSLAGVYPPDAADLRRCLRSRTFRLAELLPRAHE